MSCWRELKVYKLAVSGDDNGDFAKYAVQRFRGNERSGMDYL